LLIETEQGKVAQRVEVTGRERGPVKITLQETLRQIAEAYGSIQISSVPIKVYPYERAWVDDNSR